MNKNTPLFRAHIASLLSTAFALLVVGSAHASLQLQSSVVVVDADEGEGVISLKNNAKSPVLLHSAVVDIDEDKEPLLLVTPPITRVDPGDTQLVRFILRETDGRPVERLRRATFEGIEQAKPGVVSIGVRQNIPVIIRPKGLSPNREPWTSLRWTRADGQLKVSNQGPYVVRMSADLEVAGTVSAASLPRTYILPGETLSVAANPAANISLSAATTLSFRPASINGYLLDPVTVSLPSN